MKACLKYLNKYLKDTLIKEVALTSTTCRSVEKICQPYCKTAIVLIIIFLGLIKDR